MLNGAELIAKAREILESANFNFFEQFAFFDDPYNKKIEAYEETQQTGNIEDIEDNLSEPDDNPFGIADVNTSFNENTGIVDHKISSKCIKNILETYEKGIVHPQPLISSAVPKKILHNMENAAKAYYARHKDSVAQRLTEKLDKENLLRNKIK